MVKDTIKSTDDTLRPGSVHDVVYVITSPVNTSDEKYLEKWLSYEESVTKLPFVVNVAKLAASNRPPSIFGISIDTLINNSTLLNILLQRFSNATSTASNSTESDRTASRPSTTVGFNSDRPAAANNFINGTIVLNYTTALEREARIKNILALWKKQFGKELSKEPGIKTLKFLFQDSILMWSTYHSVLGMTVQIYATTAPTGTATDRCTTRPTEYGVLWLSIWQGYNPSSRRP
jgi:hypothetical protein